MRNDHPFVCECGNTRFLQASEYSMLEPGLPMVLDDDQQDSRLQIQCANCRTIYVLTKGEFVVAWRSTK